MIVQILKEAFRLRWQAVVFSGQTVEAVEFFDCSFRICGFNINAMFLCLLNIPPGATPEGREQILFVFIFEVQSVGQKSSAG